VGTSYVDGRSKANGVASSITGTSVTRGLGGAGVSSNAGNVAGVANSGNGGDIGLTSNASGLAGGSGVVILRYPIAAGEITIGAGLTGTTATVGANNVTTITAGTGNVSWT
jgi:hypothetical protein